MVFGGVENRCVSEGRGWVVSCSRRKGVPLELLTELFGS